MNETIPQAFAAAVRRDPTTPLLTWYDDASGDRTELSGATLDNWVSKTANLLIDGAGLGTGDAVAVLLPPHWQTAAILLGASAAGLAVDLGGDPQPVEALFTAPDRVDGRRRAGRPATGTRPGCCRSPCRCVRCRRASLDYPTEVRNYGDHFRPAQPVAAGRPGDRRPGRAEPPRGAAGPPPSGPPSWASSPATGCWSTPAPTRTRSTGCSRRWPPAPASCSAPTLDPAEARGPGGAEKVTVVLT